MNEQIDKIKQKKEVEIVIPWAFPSQVKLLINLSEYKNELYQDKNGYKMPKPPIASGFIDGINIKGKGNKKLNEMILSREDKRIYFYVEE